ncbi:hypothetical protein MMC09_003936 [Bachmanniomyces sp. S44760]|nr:hypothetical protein [Bachmanniomyces sp. S44760]
MPSVSVHLPDHERSLSSLPNPLPQLLQTPAGIAILEIQGAINMPPADSLESTDSIAQHQIQGTRVGRLVFPNYSEVDPAGGTAWMKTVYLYVGKHQRLTGEVKKLPNPIAVVGRKDTGDAIDHLNEELQILEIVYHKVLFSSRPEPVGEPVEE